MVQQNDVPFYQQIHYNTIADGQFHCASRASESLLEPWDDKPSSLRSYLQEVKKQKMHWRATSHKSTVTVSVTSNYHWVHPFDMSSLLKSTSTCKQKRVDWFLTQFSTTSSLKQSKQVLLFPEALCVWTGSRRRSSLLHLKSSCAAPPWRHWTQTCNHTRFSRRWKITLSGLWSNGWSNRYANPRLIINWVQGSLHGSRLPPASSALVRQQIEAYEGIGAIFGEGYQVTDGTSEKNHFNLTATWSMLMLQHSFSQHNCVSQTQQLVPAPLFTLFTALKHPVLQTSPLWCHQRHI